MDKNRLKALAKRWLLRIGVLVGVPTLINKLGDACNILAINANYGVMPCDNIGCTVDDAHTIWKAGMHLHLLCDFIPVGPYIVSIGDLLILLGLWGCILGIGGLLTLAVHDKLHL